MYASRVLLAVVFGLLVAFATAQTSFSASNVLVSDLVGGAGRSFRADIQYWANSGQQAILYTVPFTLADGSTGQFLIFEDYSSGLRYVQCSESCRVESLSGASFPSIANSQGLTNVDFSGFTRTIDIDSASSISGLSARPQLPSLCTAQTSASSTDNCLPFGLPCGSSCICLGCTDGDNCTGTRNSSYSTLTSVESIADFESFLSLLQRLTLVP